MGGEEVVCVRVGGVCEGEERRCVCAGEGEEVVVCVCGRRRGGGGVCVGGEEVV